MFKEKIIIPPDTFITPKELLNIKQAQGFYAKKLEKAELVLVFKSSKLKEEKK
jgi:hypothetical protein